MYVKKRRIEKKPHKKESSWLTICFTRVDAKKALQKLLRTEFALDCRSIHTAEELKDFLKRECLSFLPERDQREQADWLFSTALDEGYVVTSEWVDESTLRRFYIPDGLLDLRPGPKKKSEETQSDYSVTPGVSALFESNHKVINKHKSNKNERE